MGTGLSTGSKGFRLDSAPTLAVIVEPKMAGTRVPIQPGRLARKPIPPPDTQRTSQRGGGRADTMGVSQARHSISEKLRHAR
jgi:hypothetical protein